MDRPEAGIDESEGEEEEEDWPLAPQGGITSGAWSVSPHHQSWAGAVLCCSVAVVVAMQCSAVQRSVV